LENEKIRVMIIDDSALMRNLISTTLADSKYINVVGTAINGRFGIKKLNLLKPDIIILDLEMPDMNGIEFLQERQKLNFKTPIIILSALAKKGAKITLDALSLGASDFILKPTGSVEEITKTRQELVDMICALGKPNSFVSNEIKSKLPFEESNKIFESQIQIEEAPKLETREYLRPVSALPDNIEIIAIGISTGGPNALREILPLFPENFPIPIAIVQHMPPGFTFELAKGLNNICALEVKEAEDGDVVKAGKVYIAPGDKHIKFLSKRLANIIKLDDGPPVNGHRPSADILFESIAEVYGGNSIACIMTGMGKDGAVKIGDIMKKGGITIAQDQYSSVVFGMPKCAIEFGNIQFVSPLLDIPKTIFNILEKRKNKAS
jgi:two-component system, chemotaxis family, protein-glutamate methylesterase/glutaminase